MSSKGDKEIFGLHKIPDKELLKKSQIEIGKLKSYIDELEDLVSETASSDEYFEKLMDYLSKNGRVTEAAFIKRITNLRKELKRTIEIKDSLKSKIGILFNDKALSKKIINDSDENCLATYIESLVEENSNLKDMLAKSNRSFEALQSTCLNLKKELDEYKSLHSS